MNETITRKDLAAVAAAGAKITKVQGRAAVDTVFEAIANAIKGGNTVRVDEFGVFSRETRSPRVGRNPRTGEPIKIPGRGAPKFKPNLALKRLVA